MKYGTWVELKENDYVTLDLESDEPSITWSADQ
jgi:hypothetical protein